MPDGLDVVGFAGLRASVLLVVAELFVPVLDDMDALFRLLVALRRFDQPEAPVVTYRTDVETVASRRAI